MEKNFKVLLWCGAGYFLTPFFATAFSEDQALEIVVANLIKSEQNKYYLTVEEFEKEYTQEEEENGETPYMYIDATMEGAPYPVYLLTENARIEEI